jgi:hypothetical protein
MYHVHKKEMIAVVHCLQIWKHYMLGKSFTTKMDSVPTSYFATQPKFSPTQARWRDFLLKFDMVARLSFKV